MYLLETGKLGGKKKTTTNPNPHTPQTTTLRRVGEGKRKTSDKRKKSDKFRIAIYFSSAHLYSLHTHSLIINFDNREETMCTASLRMNEETERIITAKPEFLKIVSIQSIS